MRQTRCIHWFLSSIQVSNIVSLPEIVSPSFLFSFVIKEVIFYCAFISEIPSDSDSSRRPSQAPSDFSCVSVSVTPSPSSPPLTGITWPLMRTKYAFQLCLSIQLFRFKQNLSKTLFHLKITVHLILLSIHSIFFIST